MQLVTIAENPVPPGADVTLVPVGPVQLRVASWLPARDAMADCPGTVLVCPGRGEFIEKYAEVIGTLLARRLAVVVIDWRGQGGSSRLLADPRKGHVRSFAEYRLDLEAVIASVLLPACPRPFFALGHSMGGAIALDYAAGGPSAVFDRIVLSAPMLSIYGLRAPRATRRLAAAVTVLGGGHRYIPGGSGESWMTKPFAGNGLTSDPQRYAAFGALARAAPHLVIGAPTFGWLHAAFTLMARLDDPVMLQRIAVPVLAIACGADKVVETRTTERVVGRVKGGRTITIPHAMHEIMMEADAYQTQFWAAFDRFVPGSPPIGSRPLSRSAEHSTRKDG